MPKTVVRPFMGKTGTERGDEASAEPARRGPRALFIGVNYAPEPTGIGPYTAGMAEGLAARGWEVDVITGHPHYPWWRIPEEHRDLPSTSVENGVTVHRVHHFVPRRHRMATRVLHEVTFGARAASMSWGRPDVVVVVSPALLAARMVMAKAEAFGIPTIAWIQDIYSLGVREVGDGRGAGLIERVERSLTEGAERVVVIHDRFRRMLEEDLGTTSPIDVVRNWSHVPDLTGRRSAAMRARLGWKDDDVIVLHAGNMGAKQGLDHVVAASRLAAERKSRVRFVLMGDGNCRARLEEMGGNPNLQFVDPLPEDDFQTALASADILLVNECPGLTEMSVPSKLTTYFATGLPVLAAVAPTSTTYDEILAAGEGPTVAAGDPSAILARAEELAADPVRAAELGRAGQEYRRRLLTERAAVAGFELVLTDALRTQARVTRALVNSTVLGTP